MINMHNVSCVIAYHDRCFYINYHSLYVVVVIFLAIVIIIIVTIIIVIVIINIIINILINIIIIITNDFPHMFLFINSSHHKFVWENIKNIFAAYIGSRFGMV